MAERVGPKQVPQPVRVELVHAYAQMVAETCGVDILHIKGAAVDATLMDGDRSSGDVDILVRPAHVDVLVRALQDRGWSKMTGFEEGSAFGHAMNLRHDLGLIDLHRSWPGFEIPVNQAFDMLWDEREHKELGKILCATPSLAHQRLILLLHYGRSGGQRQEDHRASWSLASPDERAETLKDVAMFKSDVAFAAATGSLELYRGTPQYRLWKYFASGNGNRLDEWGGRWQAAHGVRERFRVLRGFILVNHDLLRVDLGHEPSRWEKTHAQGIRTLTALREICHLRAGYKARGKG